MAKTTPLWLGKRSTRVAAIGQREWWRLAREGALRAKKAEYDEKLAQREKHLSETGKRMGGKVSQANDQA